MTGGHMQQRADLFHPTVILALAGTRQKIDVVHGIRCRLAIADCRVVIAVVARVSICQMHPPTRAVRVHELLYM